MLPYHAQPFAQWFAGLPPWLAFAVADQTARLTPDRSVDAEGNVSLRFPDGVRRVPLAELRYWPLA